MKVLTSCSLSRDLSIGFSRSRQISTCLCRNLGEIFSRPMLTTMLSILSTKQFPWRYVALYHRWTIPAPFGRCFSSVDEFLIPARRRGKEGERGKGRREKKEERDMRQTNYENNSIYIFKMLRHLLTLFLCWLLYFYHQPTGCSCVLYAQLESLYLFIFVVSIILYYLPIFSLYLWFYISYLLFYKYLVLFIIVIYVVSYRLLSLTICNIFRFIYVHS